MRAHALPALCFLAPVLSLVGCQNACQRICFRMADYAEECGILVSEAEVQACLDAQAGKASRDDRDVCREFGDAQDLRDEWTCEDLETYWSEQQSNEETTDSGG